MVWALCVPLVVLYLFCGRHLMGVFLESPTELALDSGIAFLRILSPFYFVVSSKLVADGILRGVGMMRQFMIATFTDLILRVVMAFLLSGTVLGYTGIWCAWPIGWTVATVLSIAFYCGGVWNRKGDFRRGLPRSGCWARNRRRWWDTELEQVPCFDGGIDAELFVKEKSTIFLILPEEDATRNFVASLMIQNLARELFTVANEYGGKLPNRAVFFFDELGTMPPFDILPPVFCRPFPTTDTGTTPWAWISAHPGT